MPIAAWFRGPLRDLPREILLDEGTRARGLFREQYVRDLIDQHLAGTQDNSSRIWALIQLELWFRTFVDSRMDRPLDVGFALVA